MSPHLIEKQNHTNILFMVLMDGLTPPIRSISHYRHIFGCY